MNRHFQAKCIKYQHLHIIQITVFIPTTFCSDKYQQIPLVCGPHMQITNPRWRMAAILKKYPKITISQQRLTDPHEILGWNLAGGMGQPQNKNFTEFLNINAGRVYPLHNYLQNFQGFGQFLHIRAFAWEVCLGLHFCTNFQCPLAANKNVRCEAV